jgi:hypothetical protein
LAGHETFDALADIAQAQAPDRLAARGPRRIRGIDAFLHDTGETLCTLGAFGQETPQAIQVDPDQC